MVYADSRSVAAPTWLENSLDVRQDTCLVCLSGKIIQHVFGNPCIEPASQGNRIVMIQDGKEPAPWALDLNALILLCHSNVPQAI